MAQQIYIVLIFLFSTVLYAESAKDVVAKADELIKSKSSYSEMKMSVIKPDWSREIEMKTWSFEPEFALVLINAPAKDKGTVTLKREKEVWNWIPSVHRVIKIPPSMMMQSWMGSDFTNDDLVKQSSVVKDYVHSFAGEEEVDGYLCHKIQMIPKPEAGVVWGKVIMWVSKQGYLQLRADYFDEDEYLVKSMIGSKIKKMGGRTIPTHWEMIPVDKPGQKTVMEYISIEFNIDINESFFSQQNMKRVR